MKTKKPTDKALQALSSYQQRVYIALNKSIPEDEANPLVTAMRYSLLANSKRLRPALVYALAECFSQPLEKVDHIACAVECLHTFSLIHDDLPAMDNDDMRRGQASCHIQFNEATAILAGDALLCHSFELLTKNPSNHLTTMVAILAKATGCRGMSLGQQIDCSLTNTTCTNEDIIQLHELKTGALFQACLTLCALALNQHDDQLLTNLNSIGKHLGIAFQLKDDILDITGNPNNTGKPIGSDSKANKASYAHRYGIDTTSQLAKQHYQTALKLVEDINIDNAPLQLIMTLFINRDN